MVFYDPIILGGIAFQRIACIRKKYLGCATCGGILHFVTGLGAFGMRLGLFIAKASDSTSGTQTDKPKPHVAIIIFGPIFLHLG